LPIISTSWSPSVYSTAIFRNLIHYQANIPQSKNKTKRNIKEVKDMIYKEIKKKQEQADPEKFNIRIVEDNLAEVEVMQQISAMIIDELR
jgi:hypothetical protein